MDRDIINRHGLARKNKYSLHSRFAWIFFFGGVTPLRAVKMLWAFYGVFLGLCPGGDEVTSRAGN